ncbi:ABC transporter permease subunit [Streptomyces sp. DASNCL29]|uniref:PhnE/PtxC family ABC transporter permease n=1 Tax=Streptomyces sp. DASNCL29 TaxID=2583819 RepID=UPI001F0EEA2C|nr:ABC transporter permease subunit [Streptomyces sp. DASNCL29]
MARFFRTVILLVRAVPELVLAIVFVVVTGLGAVSGALALGVGSVGLLGKLVADSLEETDPGPARALVATGARRHQVFFGAVLPRPGPRWWGICCTSSTSICARRPCSASSAPVASATTC